MKSNEWYTPAKYIEAAREVMGSIDLDPASCELANRTVKATTYYTKEQNGLLLPWYGNVWLNPPYGKTHGGGNGSSNLQAFTHKLLCEYQLGHVKQAIYLTHVDTSTRWFQACLAYPICFHKGRIGFKLGEVSTQPDPGGRYPVCFVYLGPYEQLFIDTFCTFGVVVKPVSPQPTRPTQLYLDTPIFAHSPDSVAT